MHYLITALGSYGDVHPMVGLGATLARRGHRISLIANPNFADVVRSAGLDLVPVGTTEEYLEFVHHPHLWHPILGQIAAFRYSAEKALRPVYDLVTATHTPGETVFCAHGLDMASRIAAEKLGAPLVSVNFAPAAFLSTQDATRPPAGLWGPYVPRWLMSTQFWIGENFVLGPVLERPINKLRRELGLKPVKNIITRWWHQADLVLGLFPDWFAEPQPDWPTRLALPGFPVWDAPDEQALPSEANDFLAAGSPPIVFTPGTANTDAASFFVAAVDACQHLDRRGVLLTKYTEQLPGRLPPTVKHLGFIPLSQLLPRAEAFVHHGGIGSCAQGLAAGVPQLVRPLSFDQFDNSIRLQRLGVAEELSVRRFHAKNVASALDRLLTSPEVRQNCRQWAAECDGARARELAANALELVAPRSAGSETVGG